MTREELQSELAAFPGATAEYPFDFTTRVYKVGGKIFAIMGDDAEPFKVSLKCDPDIAEELREEYPGIVVPGYHLNKRHWNTVTIDVRVADDDLRDWLAHSYDRVFGSLTRSVREQIAPL
ncbi:MAG: MmcQ/YjbR family DNA-binding protein [Armatimonadetes bacterium]|nr:MmcQ/YjbR family DNA-binding protein [Armatimonadota bacterium]